MTDDTAFQWVKRPEPVIERRAFIQATTRGQRLVVTEGDCPNEAQVSGAWDATTTPVEVRE